MHSIQTFGPFDKGTLHIAKVHIGFQLIQRFLTYDEL